jgi:molybdate transport system permease protein
MDATPLIVTGRLALWVTPLLVVVCMPLAWALAFSAFPGKGLIEAACNLPLVLPPTVLGFFLLMALGPASPLGRVFELFTGARLAFSFPGLVLASMVYSLPFALQPMKTAFARLDRRLLEASSVLGLGRVGTFFRVVLPNSRGGVASACILVFAHTMGEFGVALMVGGSIPGETKVASIAIFEHVESLQYAAATKLSLVLLVVSYLVLLGIAALERGRRWD